MKLISSPSGRSGLFALLFAAVFSLWGASSFADGNRGGWHRPMGHHFFHEVFEEALEAGDLSESQEERIEALFDSAFDATDRDRRGPRKAKGFSQEAKGRMPETLKALLSKESVTAGDLDAALDGFERQVNRMEESPMFDFVAGIHGILDERQREAFRTAFLKEVESMGEGSFFSNLFKRNPVDRMKSRVTRFLSLDEAQTQILDGLADASEWDDFRALRTDMMEAVAADFTSPSFDAETLRQTMQRKAAEHMSVMKAKIRAKYPVLINLHASLTEQQKSEALDRLDKWAERGRRHHRGDRY